MIDLSDIPDEPIERVEMLEGLLVGRATGGQASDPHYKILRRYLLDETQLSGLVPSFVKTHRSLDTFWPFIKKKADTYADRREIIGASFAPLFDYIETRKNAPGDNVMSDKLAAFNFDSVHAVWEKALARREADPEGAITVARTLLETVIKRILDEKGDTYSNGDSLPKLYYQVAEQLNLTPNQHAQEPIKKILGGSMSVVNGIGTLRNSWSDAHGTGDKSPVRPTQRHATLAVNMAGTMATFLAETYLETKSS